MSPIEKSHIFRNLAKYVRTGMGIEKACDALLSQPGVKPAERSIYESILKGVQSGKSIADAMSQASPLTILDHQMLTAAERGGRLEFGLNHLGEYYERLDRTRRKIRRGLAYPVFLFHFGLLATTFTVAMFSRFSLDSEPKPLGEALWDAGQWAVYLYLALLLLLVALWYLKDLARSSPWAEKLINRVPFLGKARKFAALERFCSVFEIFLLAGMKMDETFLGAGKASHSGSIRKLSLEGAKSVKEGNMLSETFLKHPAAFPSDFARGIAAAEDSGMLDIEFGRWKQFYSESLGEALDQLAEWVPKLIYFTTVFVVGGMIIRVGLSYRDLIMNIIDTGF